jgi:hypothetical protein
MRFVIFGAWRRAVRDADVEALDEGELPCIHG